MNSQGQTAPDENRESYLRWQAISQTQLGYAINLMMTLSGAIVAFTVKGKLDGTVKAGGCGWHFALLCLGLSVLFAIAANVTRAWDFRYSRRAARARMKDGNDHQGLHDTAELLGDCTWRLFSFQAATFAIGIVFLAWSLRSFV